MTNKTKISSYRKEVIERAINIEMLVNAIISQKYFGRVVLPFVREVLLELPFFKKIEILQKFGIDGEVINKLHDIRGIRNIFAHRNLSYHLKTDENWKVVSLGKKENKDLAENDFERNYQKFVQLAPEVEAELFIIYDKMGGEWRRE